jgi:hypothetical protein
VISKVVIPSFRSYGKRCHSGRMASQGQETLCPLTLVLRIRGKEVRSMWSGRHI